MPGDSARVLPGGRLFEENYVRARGDVILGDYRELLIMQDNWPGFAKLGCPPLRTLDDWRREYVTPPRIGAVPFYRFTTVRPDGGAVWEPALDRTISDYSLHPFMRSTNKRVLAPGACIHVLLTPAASKPAHKIYRYKVRYREPALRRERGASAFDEFHRAVAFLFRHRDWYARATIFYEHHWQNDGVDAGGPMGSQCVRVDAPWSHPDYSAYWSEYQAYRDRKRDGATAEPWPIMGMMAPRGE